MAGGITGGTYDVWLLVMGLAVMVAAVLPRLLTDRPVSMPLLLLALGIGVGLLPLGLDVRQVLNHTVVERITELGVIVALMGAGLRIHRPVRGGRWASTWRLLGVTMVLTVAAAAFIGWQLAALAPASAVLLGAVMAPTDPVLASEVQAHPPGEVPQDSDVEAHEAADPNDDEVRFALTSEAGLNDGLAFPFTHLAIALALTVGGFAVVARDWLLIDVSYRIVVGLVGGLVAGGVLSVGLRHVPKKTHHATAVVGLFALAATLLIYGLTQLAGGYGFIAVFVGALVIHRGARSHPYHFSMTVSAEQTERLLTAVILVGVGIAVASGVLAALTWPLVAVALLLVFVVRPLAGVAALVGHARSTWPERWFIAFFGIRGIGSLYYLAYATGRADFGAEAQLWAVVVLVVVISVVVHGVSAAPLARRLDRRRDRSMP